MRQLSFLPDSQPFRGRITNVASVPQRSPFRYPGGKTWLVPVFREWMRSLPRHPTLLVEPFCGGAIIGLTAAMENLAKRVLLGEKDPHVACIWRVLLSQPGGAEELARRILDYRLTRARVLEDLDKKPRDEMDHAFQTVLRNRVQRGGILAPGASVMKTGENGKGIASRWYPETLARRIREIALFRNRIEFIEGDAFDLIRDRLSGKNSAFFLDPPYTAGGKKAGKRLYACNGVDHDSLFQLAASAAGPVMLTYDDAPEVRRLAERYGFDVQTTPMKNTHHAAMLELVITKPPRG